MYYHHITQHTDSVSGLCQEFWCARQKQCKDYKGQWIHEQIVALPYDIIIYFKRQKCEYKEIALASFHYFLDASSDLHKRVCPSVRPSVLPSVHPSVRPSVTPVRKCVPGASNGQYWLLFITVTVTVSFAVSVLSEDQKRNGLGWLVIDTLAED